MFTSSLRKILFLGTAVSTLLIFELILNYPADGNEAKSSVTPNLQTSCDDLIESKTQTFSGKLIYEEIPSVMSTRAYKGEEFFLITNTQNQNRLVLLPSKKVSRTDLQSFHNKIVEITAVYVEGTRPSPNKTACPVDIDGQCMRQGDGYQVLFISAID
jgi:hypothetical protein